MLTLLLLTEWGCTKCTAARLWIQSLRFRWWTWGS